MIRHFKISFLLALSVLFSVNSEAHSSFFSIGKKCDRVGDVAEAGGKLKPSEFKRQKDFYEAWDKFCLAVAVAEGTTAVTSLARSVTVPRSFAELNNIVTAKWAGWSTRMRNAWTGLKSLEVAQAGGAFGGNAKVGGTFVTTTKGATRNELAVLDDWNSMRFEAKIEIPTQTKLNIGKVGPKTSDDGLQVLTGGGDQVILPFQ